jgi:hypothetical protein
MKIMMSFWMMALSFVIANTAGAVTCDSIREKAAPPKKGNKPAACYLLDHTPGYSRGSTISTYSCGGKKFTLTMLENGDCSVAGSKK